MARPKKREIYVCALQAEEQNNAAVIIKTACMGMYDDTPETFGNLKAQLEFFASRKRDVLAYYHGLKYYGAFWLDWLLKNGYRQAFKYTSYAKHKGDWADWDAMPEKSFKCLISENGIWYNFVIRSGERKIEIWDSSKIIPYTLEQMPTKFSLKNRPIRNDIISEIKTIRETLLLYQNKGYNRMTIGACAMNEFRKDLGYGTLQIYFEDLTNFPSPDESESMEKWVRRAYAGGWCYLVPGKIGHRENGITVDANALYLSQMHSDSGNKFPYGIPEATYIGKLPPEKLRDENHFFFVRIISKFEIKPGMLPFIRATGNLNYQQNECLITSDLIDLKTGKRKKGWIDAEGKRHEAELEMTLTEMEFELFKEHYDIKKLKIVDSVLFSAKKGIFDKFINRFREERFTAKTAGEKTLTKLIQNNITGKIASNTDSSYKVAAIDEKGRVKFDIIEENKKKTGYIPIGAAITSYARCATIRAAQKNYFGPDKPGFCYADTDSLHCDNYSIKELKGVKIDPKAYGSWKLESEWDVAQFAKRKCYIEHVIKENGEFVLPYYMFKCSGMGVRCKQLFIDSVKGREGSPETHSPEEIEFLKIRRTLEDFKPGLKVPGKKVPVRVDGGIIYRDYWYTLV